MQGLSMSHPDALTASDIARLARVTRATVSNWRRRHADFPSPSGGTGASPAYHRSEVEAWLAARGALPEVPMHERLWRHIQDVANNADLGETVTWAAQELAAACGVGADGREAQRASSGFGRSDVDDSRAGKFAALSRELREAAQSCGPADVLDPLITRYAEVSNGRIAVTARPVAELMAAIAGPESGTVLDPACGTGELLAAAARYGAAKLVGQDLDTSLAELTNIRLTISRGVRDTAVSSGDSLHNDNFHDLVADAVLCHPPFGDRDWGQEELVLDPRWKFGTPPKAEPELAWAQHALAHLRPGGRAVLVMPPAAAGRPSGRRIRAEMLRRGAIKAVIALGPGAIYPRHVGPHLWVLEQPRDTSPEPRVLLIDSAEQDTILTAWRSFAARNATVGGPESDAWRSVAVIDLLDESVDLTPSRHVGIGAAESSPAEAAEAVDASQARLRAALKALSRTLPGADWTPPDRGLSWREVSIADLANSGTLQLHRASAVRDAGQVRISRGDVLLPVTAAGPVRARVATKEDDGAALDRGLHLLRPDPEQLDPWFLAGFLGHPARLQQAKYGTSSMRIDVRRLTIPLLPLPEQRQYATAFQRLRDFSAMAIEVARHARELTGLLGDSLTQGVLVPGNDSEKLALQTFRGCSASTYRHHGQTELKEGDHERG